MGLLPKEDRAGVWVTLIVHLSVIIILLISQIDSTRMKDSSFVLDFTKQEEIERQQKEAEELMEKIERAEQMRAELQQKIDRQLGSQAEQDIKNIVTDRNGNLKDDRGTDVNKLMDDARRLEGELRRGFKLPTPKGGGGGDVAADEGEDDDDKPAGNSYSGASVLSWQLDGREAMALPVPAYKCYGAGTITVIIAVNRAGKVIEATVQSGSSDACLRREAVNAAKRSRFNASDTAPEKQIGNIIYEFIAQ